MEVSMLDAAWEAAVIMADPTRLMFLATGVLVGLALGVIPGLGGIVGMALLLPFTFDLDQYSAFALLLGMGSVTTTSDTIPAVLFGVPGARRRLFSTAPLWRARDRPGVPSAPPIPLRCWAAFSAPCCWR